MTMGIVEKLKRLHKQTLLKLKDIKRVEIAKEAGVDSQKYLNRARTLHSYLNPDENKEESESVSLEDSTVNSENASINAVDTPPKPVSSTKNTASKKASKSFKM